MKNSFLLFLCVFTLAFVSIRAQESGNTLKILNSGIQLKAGETEELEAVFTDTSGVETDTAITWSVEPAKLGHIEKNLFYADSAGTGLIIAQAGGLADTISVVIENGEDQTAETPAYKGTLIVAPKDTVLVTGSTLQYAVYYVDSLGNHIDTTAIWEVQGNTAGVISAAGLFEAKAAGIAVIKARLDDLEGFASVVVKDTVKDPTGINTITITKTSPNKAGYAEMQVLTEGEYWNIGGLPSPMNILNGGTVYFPMGSLKEDIRIHMDLPKFAAVKNDSVDFGKEIVNAVEFKVYVNNKLTEPYYFEVPLNVVLPFKRGLLKARGIDPASLGLYFANVNDSNIVSFDSAGISHTVVDSASNKIYSTVAHFSTLVVKETEKALTGTTDPKDNIIPDFRLSQNYPNPFNPSTSIEFSINKSGQVNLAVYNMLGQQVASLINNENMNAGAHIVTYNAVNLPSGVYFYELRAGEYRSVKKMQLLK